MKFDDLPASVKAAFTRSLRSPKGMGAREKYMRPDEVKDLLVLAFEAGESHLKRLVASYVKECGGAQAKTAADWGKDVVLLTLRRRAARIMHLKNALRKVERLNDEDSSTWRHDIEEVVLGALAKVES